MLAVAAAGCTIAPEPQLVDGIGWPPDEPRVRLERVLASRRDVPGGRVLGWLGGTRDEALFNRPFAVAWAGDTLVVTDPGAGRVVAFPANGRPAHTPEGLVGTPVGVAACPAGIVVTDAASGRVLLLDDALRQRAVLAEGLVRPTGVACGGESVLVVETGAHRVLVLGPGGSRTHFGARGAGAGEFNFPTALAVGHGSAWVGDTLNFRIQRLNLADGRFQSELGSNGDAPGETPRTKGLALDRDGNLWVSDAHLDLVSVFAPDGRYLMSLGHPGSAPGGLAFPAGVAAHPDGRIAVADSFNRRVLVYRLAEETTEVSREE
jgi:sugar lactone lactonase YvrE